MKRERGWRVLGVALVGGISLMFSMQAVEGKSSSQKIFQSAAYVLQADQLSPSREAAAKTLGAAGRDVYVLDRYYTGGEGNQWTSEDLKIIRHGTGRVLAYVSIGEAENYRSYWQSQWKTSGAGTPPWLLSENPHWPGNFKVKYWHAEWQAMILDQLQKVVDQGFDGVYLDIIDGFEFFEFVDNKWHDHRVNPETGQSYRRDMVAWVQKVAQFVRQKNPNFIVVPQNGSQLLAEADYRAVVSGIGLEDVFTINDQAQPKDHQDYVLGFVDQLLVDPQKFALFIEYAPNGAVRQKAMDQLKTRKALYLFTDRALVGLGVSGESK